MPSLSFELIQGIPIVPVLVNGQGPFRFVLDTAASKTLIDRELAERLRLPESHEAMALGAGGLVPVRLTRVGELRLGELSLRDLEIGITDLSAFREVLNVPVEGILGSDVLEGSIITIDYRRRLLSIER
mgnify:CR=1 FL=1